MATEIFIYFLLFHLQLVLWGSLFLFAYMAVLYSFEALSCFVGFLGVLGIWLGVGLVGWALGLRVGVMMDCRTYWRPR